MVLVGFCVAFGAAFGWYFGKKMWPFIEALVEAADVTLTRLWRGLRSKRDAG